MIPMRAATRLALAASLVASLAPSARAQEGVIVYTLGRDTVAIEQFVRAGNRLTGEMVSRSATAVTRTKYEMALGAGGRPTSMVIRRSQGDGSPIPNAPTEYRLTFRADSAIREIVFPDRTQTTGFAAANAFPALPVFAYGPLELLHALGRSRAKVDSLPALGLGGNALGFVGLEPLGGDTTRLRGGFYPMLLRFDRDGRLQSVDGSLTTNKVMGTRVPGRVDFAALTAALRPIGALSPRQAAQAMFAQGPIIISYGSPAVRGRTVWGGTLVPFDSIWRLGANEATHLATSKTIQLGDMTLTPGMYTLWVQHTRAGTFLIVNRQVGQWGTIYDAKQDVGRVAMELANAPEHIENLAITIRPMPQGRGAIDVGWGDKVATATFTLRQ